MASYQLIGIYSGELVAVIAHVLKNLGSARAMVVHGLEGLDEISLCGPTKVAELRDGKVKEYTLEPEQFGFTRCRLEELHGGNAEAERGHRAERARGQPGLGAECGFAQQRRGSLCQRQRRDDAGWYPTRGGVHRFGKARQKA